MKRIFISSTFRDMQYERDMFHTIITPELNKYAEQYGETVSFCDLRWGVNTSELESDEGARKVLSVCLNEIDRCKPYMVVLLGDRYGWIPDKSLIKETAAKKQFDIDDVERSVTALEIEYGALRDEAQLSRTLFYFREFEGDIPEGFGSADEKDKKRLAELKARIKKLAGNRVKTYRVRIDEEEKSITGLSDFAKTVVSDIKNMMEEEWKAYAELPLYEKIDRTQWNIAQTKAQNFIAFREQAEELISAIEHGCKHKIISGTEGCGKTTMMSYIAVQLRNSGYDVLPIYCGSSEYLDTREEVLKYLMMQINCRLGLDENDGTEITDKDSECSDLRCYSGKMKLDSANIEDISEYVTMNIGQMVYRASNMSWIKDEKEKYPDEVYQDSLNNFQARVIGKLKKYDANVNEKFIVLMDSLEKVGFELLLNRNGMAYNFDNSLYVFSFMAMDQAQILADSESPYIINQVGDSDKKKVIAHMFSLQGKELADAVVDQIISKKDSRFPIYLNMALIRLEMMNKADFDIIHAYGDNSDAIAAHLCEVIQAISGDIKDSMVAFADEASNYFGGKTLIKALEFLAIVKNGMILSEWHDILQHNGVFVSQLELSMYMNYLNGLIELDDFDVIRITSKTFKEGIIEHCNDIREKKESLLHYYAKKNLYHIPKYSYDVLAILISLDRKKDIIDYISFAGKQNDKDKRNILGNIKEVICDKVYQDERELWFANLMKCASTCEYEEVVDLVNFVGKNIFFFFRDKNGRKSAKNLLTYGVLLIEAFDKDNTNLGQFAIAECNLKIGKCISGDGGIAETLYPRDFEKNYDAVKQSYGACIEAGKYYWNALSYYKARFDETSKKHYLGMIFSIYVSLLLHYRKSLGRYLKDNLDLSVLQLEAREAVLDFESFLDVNKFIAEDEETVENLMRLYRIAKEICVYVLPEKVLLFAEKQYEMAELHNEDEKSLETNAEMLLTHYLYCEDKEKHLARIKELFTIMLKRLTYFYLGVVKIGSSNVFSQYALEVRRVYRLLSEFDDVEFLEKMAHPIIARTFELIELILKNETKWKDKETSSVCMDYGETMDVFYKHFMKEKDIQQAKRCIIVKIELIEYAYSTYKSKLAMPDYFSLIFEYHTTGEKLCEIGDDESYEMATKYIEKALGFAKQYKNDPKASYYNSLSCSDLAEIYISRGTSEDCHAAIKVCETIYSNEKPHWWKIADKLKVKAYVKLGASEYFDKIVECFDHMLPIILDDYLEALKSENPYSMPHSREALWKECEFVISVIDDAQKLLSEEQLKTGNAKTIEWLSAVAECDVREAQFVLAEQYHRELHGIEHSNEKAFPLYLKAANQGHRTAQYMVGCMYYAGLGVEKDLSNSVKWFEKAAEQGDIGAYCMLGNAYMSGLGVTQDYSKAITYYAKVADQVTGAYWAVVQHNMGACYLNGWGVEKNEEIGISWLCRAASNGYGDSQRFLVNYYSKNRNEPIKAFEWRLKLAENGDVIEQYQVAEGYYYGKAIDQDYKLAVSWYLKAAEQGDRKAQYMVGFCYRCGRGVEQNYQKAFEWLIKAAEQGHIGAQDEVGDAYYWGRGVDQNYKAAVEWYTKSAENGNRYAQYSLGCCYDYGKGVEQNHETAVELYGKSAEQGNASAQYNLGNAYRDGQGVQQDYEMAVEWYAKSAENGNRNAQYSLAYRYYYGQGVERNYQIAFTWFLKAAEKEHTDAQYEVGDAYYYGRGVEKSLADAYQWYLKSAIGGSRKGQYNTGLCLAHGYGVVKDTVKAFTWFIKAAEKGHIDAQLEVGNAYYWGSGVEKNIELAVEWYAKSAKNGNSIAQLNLGLCYKVGSGVQQDDSKAFELISKAAKQRHPRAQDELGQMYFYGRGVEESNSDAVLWFTKSAEQGYRFAQSNLGYCFKNGYGVEPDIALAFSWFMKAAEQGVAKAQYEVGNAYRKACGVSKDEEKALEWLLKAAEQGHVDAMAMVGNFYYFAWGVPQSYETALHWYSKAAEKGNVMAQYNLATCYENGYGVEQNLDLALIWFTKAAEQGLAEAQEEIEILKKKGEGEE